MGTYSIRLQDVGEGVAEAELVEWNVKVGDTVLEDEVVGAVMTDKAAVEIPSSVTGKVTWLGGEIGDVIAVGAELLRLEVDGEGNFTDSENVPGLPEEISDNQDDSAAVVLSAADPVVTPQAAATTYTAHKTTNTNQSAEAESKPLAAPSVRRRAKEAGIDLRLVSGTGPAGRINHADIDSWIKNGGAGKTAAGRQPNHSVTEVKVVGLRRKIAAKMSLAKTRIPHITIVEEVDVTNLEELRAELNDTHGGQRSKLTVLPFMMKAIVEAVSEQPQLNANFDDDAGVVYEYGAVHIGIATQTPGGLMVPVVRHCETLSLWDSAAEVARLAQASKDATAGRDELTGSTITITSLGPLGAIATTPIINHPEVAIVGINKIAVRPHWDGQQFVPRKMMNISASFDHRVVDGWDAAVMVQKLKTLLEKPAMLFVGD